MREDAENWTGKKDFERRRGIWATRLVERERAEQQKVVLFISLSSCYCIIFDYCCIVFDYSFARVHALNAFHVEVSVRVYPVVVMFEMGLIPRPGLKRKKLEGYSCSLLSSGLR